MPIFCKNIKNSGKEVKHNLQNLENVQDYFKNTDTTTFGVMKNTTF
jgi:hypothetical protein